MRTWITVVNPINNSKLTILCDEYKSLKKTFCEAYAQIARYTELKFTYVQAIYIYNGHVYKINNNCNPYRLKFQ